MSIRARLRSGNKLIIRYNNNLEEQYLTYILVNARDRPGSHPKISVKGMDGREIPSPKIPRKPSKPLAVKPPEVKVV